MQTIDNFDLSYPIVWLLLRSECIVKLKMVYYVTFRRKVNVTVLKREYKADLYIVRI